MCVLEESILAIKKSDVYTFGDAENDLAMIKSVGLGVAMKNGFDIVKEVADVVTLTNDEDGVAELVKKYLD